jgi:pentalenene oxygenase
MSTNPVAALRTLLEFQADALALFDRAGVYVHGVAEVDFGLRRSFVIGDPALATAILTSPAFDKGRRSYGPLGTFAGFGSLRGLVGPSLPVLDGEEGLARRRELMPVYSGILARFEAVAAGTRTVFPGVEASERDIYPLLSAAVFDRFCAVMFGRTYPEMAGPIGEAVSTATTALDGLSKSFLPYAGAIGVDGWRLRRSRERLLDFARRVYGDLRASDDAAAIRPLLTSGLDEAQVVDEILTQIVAGTETTTITTCWALSLLVRHPDIAARIRGDSDRSEGDGAEGGRALVARCVNETLRLYPAFWTVIRVAREPVTVEGRSFPKDAVCFVSPYCVHHNPAVWPDPERFDPDRFVNRQGVRGDFMPYGYGARACIGARLAQGIIQDTVQAAVTQLELAFLDEEPEGHVVNPLIVVLKSRTGFRFRVQSRQAPT